MTGLWNFSVWVRSWSDEIESDPVLIRKFFENHESDPVLTRQSKNMYFLSVSILPDGVKSAAKSIFPLAKHNWFKAK